MNVLQEILVPLLSVNDQSLTIQELTFSQGEKVKKGDIIAVLETSKTTYTVEAEADGYISYFCKAGDDLPVNEILAKIFDEVPELSSAKSLINGSHESLVATGEKRTSGSVKNTIFSHGALQLMDSLKLDKNLFEGCDLVNE